MAVVAYQVGGSVRDLILGLKSKDIDYAVEASSYAEMKAWVEQQGEIFLEQEQYLTIRARIGKEAADYVLCRKDSTYTDGRRPDFVIPGTLFDDLARRDFTMNAIAKYKGEDGEEIFIDPYNGIDDIENKLVTCVGRAEDRFSEDGLRILRAIRFAITKDFFLSSDIHRLLREGSVISKMDNVSEERIKDEMFKCFKHDTLRTMKMLDYFSKVRDYIFSRSKTLWLKPTLESR